MRSEWASRQPRAEQPDQEVASLHSPTSSNSWPSQQGVLGPFRKGGGFDGGEALLRREVVRSEVGPGSWSLRVPAQTWCPLLVLAQQAPWFPTCGYKRALVEISVEGSSFL